MPDSSSGDWVGGGGVGGVVAEVEGIGSRSTTGVENVSIRSNKASPGTSF